MGTKYKLNETILDKPGEIRKLERDGFTREQIHKEMYKVTDGMSTNERRRLMAKLYQRGDC